MKASPDADDASSFEGAKGESYLWISDKKQWISQLVCEKENSVKKIWFYAIVQGIVIFFIVGGMTYVLRGDFFFRYLSPIFGLAAAVLRFGTATLMKVLAPTLYDDPKKKEESHDH